MASNSHEVINYPKRGRDQVKFDSALWCTCVEIFIAAV